MRTTLNLLTRDGAVYLSFLPSLSATQYAELLELTQETVTTEELQKAVAAWAAAHGLKVSFDEMDGE